MEIEDLRSDEIIELINKLKYPKSIISFNRAFQEVNTLFGKISVEEPIIDEDDVEYFIKVYQGRLDKNRFSIHLRFKELHHHLVRVDVNPGNNHINPDGRKIIGSHIHLYSNEHPRKDAVAIPLEQCNFPNVIAIVDAFIEFLDYTNINQEGVRS